MNEYPDKMYAAMLHSAGDMRYEETAVVPPTGDEVLVEIVTNGLCGSDVHFYADGRLGPFTFDSPYVPGHEASGVVVACGPAVESAAIGRRVVVEPGIPCRKCEFCKSGRYNLCINARFLSVAPDNGTFAEYVTLPADFAHPIPDALNFETAAFAEPVAVGLQACNRAGVGVGSKVAILGAGPIGLITLMTARLCGATEVIVVDLIQSRLDKATEIGVSATIDASQRDVVAEIARLTTGRGVDVVIDTSGSAQACGTAPWLAKRGGIIAVVGWPKEGTFPYPIERIIEVELEVRGVHRYVDLFPTAIDLLDSGAYDVGSIITHRYPFEAVCDAFKQAHERPTETIKVMVSKEYTLSGQ